MKTVGFHGEVGRVADFVDIPLSIAENNDLAQLLLDEMCDQGRNIEFFVVGVAG